MYKINNPCVNDITAIVRVLYDREIIYLGEMKNLFLQLNNIAWRLYGSESYTSYIDDAMQNALICENLAEFKKRSL